MKDAVKPVSIAGAEHYTWGQVCDGWRLLQEEQLSVIQERVPPGGAEVMHFHARAHQFFYVLSGVATLELEDGSVSFGAGEGAHVPPGVPHRFRNTTSEDVVFLVISAPSTAGDRTPV